MQGNDESLIPPIHRETEEKKDIKRIPWVDVLKGMGMLLVVFQHVVSLGLASRVILAFHMPMFFIISGYLYRDKPGQLFFTSRVRSLLIPLLGFEFLNILICVTITAISSFNYKVVQFGGTWFVLTLFVVEILEFGYRLLMPKITLINRLPFVLILTVIGFLHCRQMNIARTDSISEVALAMVAYCFFYVGRLVQQYQWLNYLERSWLRYLAMLLFIVLLSLCVYLNPVHVLMYAGVFGKYLVFLTGALAGSFALALFSLQIKQCRLLEFFGRNSLLFLFLHFPVFRVLGFLLNKIVRNGLYIELVVFFITLILCSFFSLVINRYIPVLAGKAELR